MPSSPSLRLLSFDKKMPIEKIEPIPIIQDLGEIKRRLHMYQRGDWSHVEALIEIAQPLIQPKAEYQGKVKLKFSSFLRQHSSCVPLSGILKKIY